MFVPDPEFAELVSMEAQEIAQLGTDLLKWVGGILVAAITVLFGALAAVGKRIFDRQEALITALMGEQNKTTNALADSVHRVEGAVVRMDTSNVAALTAIKESVNARLDTHGALHEKHDARFAGHESDIKALHTGHAVLDFRVKAIEGKIP